MRLMQGLALLVSGLGNCCGERMCDGPNGR